jgi:toxin YoeB
VSYRLVYTKQANQDAKKASSGGLKNTVQGLLELIKNDPFKNPPRFEKLVGDLQGAISRRINIQHRLVYQVLEKENIIKIIRMWSHYE